METSPNSPSRAKNLGILALTLKLILMILIIITIIIATTGVLGSIGAKQIRGFKEDKENIEKKYPGTSVKWSPLESARAENTGYVAAFLPLVIVLISSVLQCVVSFCYKARGTPYKVIVFGDVFLSVLGFALAVFAGSMLIYGSTLHCKGEQETLVIDLKVPIQYGRSGAAKRDGMNVEITPFGDGKDSLFYPVQPSYYGTSPEDLMLGTISFDIPGYSQVSQLFRYKEECNQRWRTASKIAAGAIGILAGLAFVAIAALSIMQGLATNPTPQNAAEFQQGAYQPGGPGGPSNKEAPMVPVSPSYAAAAANPPPPYQQGYQPQVGGPQVTPSYVAAHPSQSQFQGGYQGQGGPQGNPSYAPAQPQQAYQPQGPQPQQAYQPQGPQPQQAYQPQGPQPQQGYQPQGQPQQYQQQGYQPQQGPPPQQGNPGYGPAQPQQGYTPQGPPPQGPPPPPQQPETQPQREAPPPPPQQGTTNQSKQTGRQARGGRQ